MHRSFLQLLCALVSLLRSWWQVDRVRISPREGALLRLQPPCLLMIGDQRVEVLTRKEPEEEKTAVFYTCLTDQGPATLRIDLVDQGRRTSVHWQIAGEIYQLSAEDVEVYA
jgi:hypothetical protein